MDTWIFLNNQTVGKDKLARLLQYFSRSIWGVLEQNECNPALTDQIKTLEYVLSSFRKLLRFGKCLDVFYQALKTIHYPDVTIRVALTLSKLGQALFLFCDHIVWLSRSGFSRNVDAKDWTQLSNKYWLFSIIMNLVRDVYEILHILDLHMAARRSGILGYTSRSTGAGGFPLSAISSRDLSPYALRSYACLLGHKDVVVDTVKNLCDLFIPLTALGYTNISPRVIGLLGVLSSIAGLMSVLQPTAKLVPS